MNPSKLLLQRFSQFAYRIFNNTFKKLFLQKDETFKSFLQEILIRKI